MKNIAGICILLVAGTGILSCKQKNETAEIDSLVAKFSDLECRAFTLREQRYSLADTIRFAEDSVAKAQTSPIAKKSLQEHLKSWLTNKQNIVALSLQLADTIKLQLDTIIKIRLQSKEKIDRFDKALSLALEKKHDKALSLALEKKHCK